MGFYKKLFIASAAASLIATAAFALPEGLSLENKVQWDCADISKWDGKVDVNLGKGFEQARAEYKNDFVRLGVDLKFGPDKQVAYDEKKIKGYLTYQAMKQEYDKLNLAAYAFTGKTLSQIGEAGPLAVQGFVSGLVAAGQVSPTDTSSQTLIGGFCTYGLDATYNMSAGLIYGSYDEKALDGDNYYYLSYRKIDYWLEFRPFDIFMVGLHDNFYTRGSYLPLWNDNIETGNMGSDGFTLGFDPLRITGSKLGSLNFYATVPFTDNKTFVTGDDDESYFYVSKDINDMSDVLYGSDTVIPQLTLNYNSGSLSKVGRQRFNMGFGVDYDYNGIFSAGVKISDAFDARGRKLGLYGALDFTDLLGIGLKINGGWGHSCYFGKHSTDQSYIFVNNLDMSEASGIMGKDIFNVALEFNMAGLQAVAEFATNCGRDYDRYLVDPNGVYKDNLEKLTTYFFTREYDHYIGGRLAYSLEGLTVGFNTKILVNSTDTDKINSKHDYLLGFQPTLDARIGKDTFGMSCTFSYGSDEWVGVRFPVYWKHTF